MEQWKGKVAVVTGASSGIARAIAMKLAQEGVLVAALARRENKLKELENDSACKGNIRAYVCDVSVESQVVSVMGRVENDMGPIRILINSAGINPIIKFKDLDIAVWKDIMNVDFFGSFICIKHLVNAVKQKDRGTVHIININTVESSNSAEALDWLPFYMSKIPPKMITKGLFRRFAEEKLDIKISTVDPGFVNSGAVQTMMENYPEMREGLSMIPKLEPSECAETVMAILTAPKNAIVSSITVQPVGETM